MSDHHPRANNQQEIPGVTRDPVLRPVGTLMVVVGALWILFWGMATQAGTFDQPLAAAALIFLGLVFAGIGKPEIYI